MVTEGGWGPQSLEARGEALWGAQSQGLVTAGAPGEQE